MLIGSQEHTGFGDRIDLLAIAPDASLVLIELKRDPPPREVVAQALDYAAWVEQLTADRIVKIYRRFAGDGDPAAAFMARVGQEIYAHALTNTTQICPVTGSCIERTTRIHPTRKYLEITLQI